jgi:hypothetical protein
LTKKFEELILSQILLTGPMFNFDDPYDWNTISRLLAWKIWGIISGGVFLVFLLIVLGVKIFQLLKQNMEEKMKKKGSKGSPTEGVQSTRRGGGGTSNSRAEPAAAIMSGGEDASNSRAEPAAAIMSGGGDASNSHAEPPAAAMMSGGGGTSNSHTESSTKANLMRLKTMIWGKKERLEHHV